MPHNRALVRGNQVAHGHEGGEALLVVAGDAVTTVSLAAFCVSHLAFPCYEIRV